MEQVLQTKALVKAYRGKRVVNGVDIGVSRGEVVGLLGPTTGHVFFEGRDITRLPMYRRARVGVGYLSQEPSIFRKLTVEENIMAILETLPIPARERKLLHGKSFEDETGPQGHQNRQPHTRTGRLSHPRSSAPTPQRRLDQRHRLLGHYAQ